MGEEIKRNNEYVFYQCPQYEAFEFIIEPNPYQEVSKILSTFKFLK